MNENQDPNLKKDHNEDLSQDSNKSQDDEYILVVNNLKQYFPVETNFFGKPIRYLKAVDGVSFKIKKGHTFGLVGESGCGKTTLGRTIISLYNATDGEAYFEGKNILYYDKKEKKRQEALNQKEMERCLYIDWLKENSTLSLEELKIEKEDASIKADFLLSEEAKKKIMVSEKWANIFGCILPCISAIVTYVLTLSFCKKYMKDFISRIKFIKAIRTMSFHDFYENGLSNTRKAKLDIKVEELLISYLEKNSTKTPEEMEAQKAEIASKDYVKRATEFLTTAEKRAIKTDLQMIFQDPYSSLSPRMCIGEIISEAVKEHNLVPKEELKEYTFKIMKECGLQPYYYSRYPHEFSGGQRQRIGIARSLALNPKLVICDEPVSALDVSIQAQIINLLKDLQKEKGLSYLFISHDLSVVEHISDDVGVMYLGNLVETGTKDQIFNNPAHPYTLSLLSAIPMPDPEYKSERIKLKGELPSPINPPHGCKFHTRCSKCMKCCEEIAPKEIEIEPGHMVRCHLFDPEMNKENK